MFAGAGGGCGGELGVGRRQAVNVGSAGARSFSTGEIVTVEIPEGARKLAAVLRGKDGAGEVVAVGETAVR